MKSSTIRTEDALSGSAAQALLDRCSQAILVVSPDWRITYANRKSETIFHLPLNEIRERDFWSALPELTGTEEERECRRAMRERVAAGFDFKIAPDKWLEICLEPHENGIAVYLRDLTTEKLAGQGFHDITELHERLLAIVQSSDDAIISKDLNGIIRSWNRGAEQLFGYTAEEIIGKPISILAVPERLEEIPNILERLSRGESIDHYQTERRTKDGRVLKISLTVSPIRNASGAIIGASKVARDITTEKKYSELQEHLAAIVQSSDDAIISKDLNGIIRSWNRGAERLFGYTAEEIIGKSVSILAVPERVDEIPNILERISKGERIEHYETRRRTKDGRTLSISLTVSPIRDSSGKIVGASKVARDITDRVRSQEALCAANEALSRANADLQQFAYSASHDLQEPLRMIASYGELLQKRFGNKLGTTGDEYIAYIVQGCIRMDSLLRDLRAFTQASLSGQEPAGETDANAMLQRALLDLKASIEESGAEIKSAMLPAVRVHEVHLEQLFQNLIGNAIRYRSQLPPRIYVAAERSGDAWRFSVQDNGIGIEPEYKEQIFGIFKRLHTVADYPGTGMGLAICQRIVERAGGRIWVESEPGQGSTFFFTLPAF